MSVCIQFLLKSSNFFSQLSLSLYQIVPFDPSKHANYTNLVGHTCIYLVTLQAPKTSTLKPLEGDSVLHKLTKHITIFTMILTNLRSPTSGREAGKFGNPATLPKKNSP